MMKVIYPIICFFTSGILFMNWLYQINFPFIWKYIPLSIILLLSCLKMSKNCLFCRQLDIISFLILSSPTAFDFGSFSLAKIFISVPVTRLLISWLNLFKILLSVILWLKSGLDMIHSLITQCFQMPSP